MSGMALNPLDSIERFRNASGPLVDVRSPSEYKKGHWPGAVNLPLFNDDERAKVGTTYKQKGRDKAIEQGLRFTGTKLLELSKGLKNIVNKQAATKSNTCPNSLRIYCWRGGLRSSSVAWLAELVDLNPSLLEGGYKSYRRWVLQQFEKKLALRLLGGRTGTGKTDLLKEFKKKGLYVVDLEGLANHRGSSFGALGLSEQPSTEHFENLLAEELQNFQTIASKEIWLEAESANLGRCRIPEALFKQMKEAPLLEISRPLEERVNQLIKVYSQYGAEALHEATVRISRRLGPQRTKEALNALSLHKWDQACLAMLDYYDRCYDHELTRTLHKESIDISTLSPVEATETLIEKGVISKHD